MKRVIYFVALVTVFVGCASAQDKEINSNGKFPVGVYVLDKSGMDTNIRDKPNGKIIHKLPTEGDYMLRVYNPTNGWWQIYNNEINTIDRGPIEISSDKSWIHGSVLAFGTSNYGGQEVKLYSEPNESSKVVYTITEEVLLRPVDDCDDSDWLKVKTLDGTHSGWILREWLCDSPVTNCS
jgi:SH3-like domain-containing protein